MSQALKNQIDWYTESYRTIASSESALAEIRQPAFERFAELGFPTLREEDWKYTNVAAPLTRRSFGPATISDAGTMTLEEVTSRLPESADPHIVFFNGTLSAELSRLDQLPAGVSVGSIASLYESASASADSECVRAHLGKYARSDDTDRPRPFVALNAAFLTDGAFLRIEKSAVVERPVHIVFLSSGPAPEGHDGAVTHPRILIFAERSSQATIVETHVGLDDTLRLTNAVTEVVVAESARLDHFKVQLEGPETYHVASIDAHLERSSHYGSHSYAFGARLSRNDINPTLDGEGSHADLTGLFLLGDEQHADTHSIIDHALPNCTSHELYKGILADRSRGVFSGRIIVRQDAQKTNAIQSNNNLLLSRNATVDSKPQLEIYADDVRCTHGATVGQIDEKALFYLRSRGIPLASARQMLIEAFAAELLESIKNGELKTHLETLLAAQLETKAHGE